MTASDFSRYLQQPRLLYELPLTELQQLALRFPYSPNLRLLLLLKAHLEGHPEEAEYLARCATATFDRAIVYDVLQELDVDVQEAETAEGEFLELKELDDLVLETEEPAEVQPEVLVEELPIPPVQSINSWDDISEEEEEEFLLDAMSYNSEKDLPEREATFTEDALEPVIEEEELEEEHRIETPVAVAPSEDNAKTSQGSLQERLAKIRRRQEAALLEQKEDVNRIARRSLVTQEEVASETLAKLLVRQGQYQHAIKMYQRLILLYPEKKPTFAGLIKDLKEKL